MIYGRVEISIRDVRPDKYKQLMDYMLGIGLYETARIKVDEVIR